MTNATGDRPKQATDIERQDPQPIDAPFDQYQRYRITSDVALQMADTVAPVTVLDVGGHHTDFFGRARRPIAEFLPELLTVTLDLPRNESAGYVRGRGDALPFASRSFSLVSAVDVLEHVPDADRPILIGEMVRVSSRALLLAAPFESSLVRRMERLVADFIERTCGYEQGQLREHRQMGLPDLAKTAGGVERHGWTVHCFAYGNLWRWALMMIDKHAVAAVSGSRDLHTRLDRQYNERWFDSDRELPTYRHFLLATREQDDPLLAWAAREYGATPSGDPGWPVDDGAAPAIADLLEVHAANQHLQVLLEPERRVAHVAEVEAHRRQMYDHLDALSSENQRLEALLRRVEGSLTYRIRAALRRLIPSGS